MARDSCFQMAKQIEQTNLEVSELLLRLMVEILHQLIGSLSHYLQGFVMFYTSQVVSRISSINSSFFTYALVKTPMFFPWSLDFWGGYFTIYIYILAQDFSEY